MPRENDGSFSCASGYLSPISTTRGGPTHTSRAHLCSSEMIHRTKTATSCYLLAGFSCGEGSFRYPMPLGRARNSNSQDLSLAHSHKRTQPMAAAVSGGGGVSTLTSWSKINACNYGKLPQVINIAVEKGMKLAHRHTHTRSCAHIPVCWEENQWQLR